MLEATSLAKQNYFLPSLSETKSNITFFIGEDDQKFRKIASDNKLNHQLIPNAGHISHYENPESFTDALLVLIKK